MPLFRLHRLSHAVDHTYGRLYDAEERLIAVTFEEALVDANHDGLTDKNVSCIPAGTYEAFRRPNAETRHDYDVFELLNVPGRSNIQIHIGNTGKDTSGCILLGSNFGTLAGRPAVLGSQAAFRRFMDGLRGVDRIVLDVIGPD